MRSDVIANSRLQALTVNKVAGSDMVEVGGRGELQLAVLIETMRREGFEMSVAAPQVCPLPLPHTTHLTTHHTSHHTSHTT